MSRQAHRPPAATVAGVVYGERLAEVATHGARVAELDPTCVAIVDGAFFQVPSVTHKEILLTLERGVRVLGASSLDAAGSLAVSRIGSLSLAGLPFGLLGGARDR